MTVGQDIVRMELGGAPPDSADKKTPQNKESSGDSGAPATEREPRPEPEPKPESRSEPRQEDREPTPAPPAPEKKEPSHKDDSSKGTPSTGATLGNRDERRVLCPSPSAPAISFG